MSNQVMYIVIASAIGIGIVATVMRYVAVGV